MNKLIALSLATIMASGCTATHHKGQVQDDSTDRVTVGVVQKEIYIGMSGAEVAATIGSPNASVAIIAGRMMIPVSFASITLKVSLCWVPGSVVE